MPPEYALEAITDARADLTWLVREWLRETRVEFRALLRDQVRDCIEEIRCLRLCVAI